MGRTVPFRYIVAMKPRILTSMFFAGILISALAFAQTQPAPEKADPLVFVKTAASIAGNVQHDSLDRFLGIYVSEEHWSSGSKDSDLGPFLKLKEAEAKPGRSVIFFFSDSKDAAICVYFDGQTPFGVAAVRAGASGGIQAADVAAAYKPVSKDMLKKGDQEWHFTQSGVNTDDGTSLPAFQITK